jgi:type II secretory pathway component PulF
MEIAVTVLEALGAITGGLAFYCLVARWLGFRLDLLAAVVGSLFLLIFLAFAAITIGVGPSLPVLLFLMLAIGWVLYAYFRYRQARQDELLQVIVTAVEAQLPLGPAIRAYLRDRPHGGQTGVWDGLLLFLMPPAFVLWNQRYSFDHRAADLAELLDEGASLPHALRSVRGVAPRDVKVAAVVGEATGRLATSLRRADRTRLAGAWLEVMPRLLYPLLLLAFIGGITTFLMIMVMPKMQRIFQDFGQRLPAMTERLLVGWGDFLEYQDVVTVAVPAALLLAVVLLASPTARWYLPVLGRLYRWEIQGLALRMLGTLIEVGRPAPEALGLLAGTGDFPAVARRCLGAAQRAVARGEPLAAALRGAGLLPAAMAPLVQAAERTQTLPWALAELGELLAGRAVRMARRLSLVLSPVLVVAVGLLVAFIALGMFMPLIQLLARLSE